MTTYAFLPICSTGWFGLRVQATNYLSEHRKNHWDPKERARASESYKPQLRFQLSHLEATGPRVFLLKLSVRPLSRRKGRENGSHRFSQGIAYEASVKWDREMFGLGQEPYRL